MGALPIRLSLPARSGMRRAGPWSRGWLAALVCTLVLPAALAAQVPDTVPPDTIPRDTVVVPIPPESVASDTLPADTLIEDPADTLRAPPPFPEFPDPFPVGWAYARHEWSRDELLRYRGLTVLDLLERTPGLLATRAGGFGRPAGLSTFGLGGARVRVFMDGFELDPLGYPTHELQRFGLIGLERMYVERDPSGVRIHLHSFRTDDTEPYSEIELAVGDYQTRVLRAMLSRQVGGRSVLTASYDLLTTNGVGIAEPFESRAGRFAWNYAVTENTAVELQLQQGGIERGGELMPVDADRRDILLRARSRPFPDISVEARVGHSSWEHNREDPGETPPPVDTVLVDADQLHGGLRAGYTLPFGYVEADARVRTARDGVPAPSTDLTVRAVTHPLQWLTAEGRFELAAFDGRRASEAQVTGRAGPFAGISAFATVGLGDRGLALVRDTAIIYSDTVGIDTIAGEPTPIVEERTRVEPLYSTAFGSGGGLRIGAEWTGFNATVGVAFVSIEPGLIAPFGLGFDRGIQPVDAGAARGTELYAHLPLPWTGGTLSLQGSAAQWAETGGRPYLPARQAQLALEYHTVRIEGQFEPTVRLELQHRGEAIVPDVDRTGFSATTEPYTLLNFLLQIRVLDVRAFLVWENPLHDRTALDLAPDVGFQPGQRVLYGARWFFRN